jgi:hypothetical protein
MIKELRRNIERAALHTGCCYRCGRPWKTYASKYLGYINGRHTSRQLKRKAWWGIFGVEPHSTSYTESTGCFPLCEGCWSSLNPRERVPFYGQLVDEWIRQSPEGIVKYERDRDLIFKAVLDGK